MEPLRNMILSYGICDQCRHTVVRNVKATLSLGVKLPASEVDQSPPNDGAILPLPVCSHCMVLSNQAQGQLYLYCVVSMVS